jgi:DNA-directed RNA polymerase specialized sigma24 family protein
MAKIVEPKDERFQHFKEIRMNQSKLAILIDYWNDHNRDLESYRLLYQKWETAHNEAKQGQMEAATFALKYNALAQKCAEQAEKIRDLLKEQPADPEPEPATAQKLINERGAGRKQAIDEPTREAIRNDRAGGMTYKKISEKYGISAGSINNIIHS